MHLICPPISLVTAVKPRRNEKQRVCKILGANKVHYGKCGVLASLRKSKVLSFVVSERVFLHEILKLNKFYPIHLKLTSM